MSDLEPPVINMSSIKVSGVGGLGLVAVVGVLVYAIPVVRSFELMGLAGGAVAALAYIAYRARSVAAHSQHGPTLMVGDPARASKSKTSSVPALKLSTVAARV